MTSSVNSELIVPFVCVKGKECLDTIWINELCNILHSEDEEFIKAAFCLQVRSTKVFMIFDAVSIPL